MSFLIAIFGTGVFNILSTLIVDLYPSRPGGATACNNLIRCFMGAGGTAVIESMLNSMGRGWCFTFVGLVSACMVPLLLWERKCGMRWRLAREERQKAKKEKEELKKTMKEKERADMKEKGGNNLETEAR